MRESKRKSRQDSFEKPRMFRVLDPTILDVTVEFVRNSYKSLGKLIKKIDPHRYGQVIFFFFFGQKYEGTKKANKQNKMNKTKKKRKATTTESFQSGAVEGLDPTPRQKGKTGKGREEREL